MLFRNDAAADGWLARARTLATELGPSSLDGWIALAEAEASPRPSDAVSWRKQALAAAREHRDRDLEVIALRAWERSKSRAERSMPAFGTWMNPWLQGPDANPVMLNTPLRPIAA